MNILVVDSQRIISEKQTADAKNRLYFSLLRFEHRINGATVHLTRPAKCGSVCCTINVNIEGCGIVSTKRKSGSPEKAVDSAVDAIQPKVARRIDWKVWYNTDTFATWSDSISKQWRSWIGTADVSLKNV